MATKDEISALARKWANGAPVYEVLYEAWNLGYGEGQADANAES